MLIKKKTELLLGFIADSIFMKLVPFYSELSRNNDQKGDFENKWPLHTNQF